MIRERFLAALATLTRAFQGEFTNCIISRREGEAFFVDGPAKILIRKDKNGTLCVVTAPLTTSIIREETFGKDSPLSEKVRAVKNTVKAAERNFWREARELLDRTSSYVDRNDVCDADTTVFNDLCSRYNNGERTTDLYNSIKEFCRG